MLKRDRIFYSACGLSGVGVVLAVMGYDFSILLFVAAYLLRPALHEFGLARQYADERQLTIHSRSGNIAFIVVILVAVGLALWRIARGEQPEELYTLIVAGLAARALTGLIMVGEYRMAGVVIISALGVFVSLFIILDGGMSAASIFGVVVGLLIIGFGQIARRFPKAMAIVLSIIALGAIFFFNLYEFRQVSMALWLFFVTPLAISSACLFLGSGGEDRIVSAKLRTTVFSALGAGAAIVFVLLLIFGGRDQTVTRTVALPEGEVVEVQGVSCGGPIEYFQDGKLESCTLARDDTLSGQPLSAGTVVTLTPDGDLDWCFLQQDTEIQGHLCRGSGHGFMTCFHPNGKLRLIWLADDEIIQGVPCAKYRFMSVLFGGGNGTYFHDNGKLSFCILSEDAVIDGKEYDKGEKLKFDKTGNIITEKKEK